MLVVAMLAAPALAGCSSEGSSSIGDGPYTTEEKLAFEQRAYDTVAGLVDQINAAYPDLQTAAKADDGVVAYEYGIESINGYTRADGPRGLFSIDWFDADDNWILVNVLVASPSAIGRYRATGSDSSIGVLGTDWYVDTSGVSSTGEAIEEAGALAGILGGTVVQ
jgi:hypothetical protein